ncbi:MULTISPECIES: DUF397 domain-containing protein [Actinomadura]|jgi:hypothetical protein|uniref:DUF397 domain-containing protein n=1 Tax=Actinomadura bangladeshensis TaxID=453573 RepID=A0A4R4NXX1_9ACTN|nr:DUF397 domain-containing protein [Actinomadura bangladeshensis]TDC13007.1 DUF397 domain-containing protein [Actinomadura bangladeshensis]
MDLSRATWRKASRSHDDGDQCVEVTSVLDVIAVRDSKDPDGPKIFVDRRDFRYFAGILKSL